MPGNATSASTKACGVIAPVASETSSCGHACASATIAFARTRTMPSSAIDSTGAAASTCGAGKSRSMPTHGVAIGVIAVPAVSAQSVADQMVAAGIRSILNFAPTVLSVPEGVDVRMVDLSSELQILAYHEQRKSAGGASAGEVVA